MIILTIIFWLLILLIIFYLLAKICDDYFVESIDEIVKKLNLSHDVAGATFMAVGSSAPELFTSLAAISKIGAESIGVGTIVGSAIFNILVIVGVSSIVATAYLNWRPVMRDMSFYLLSIFILLFTFSDGRVSLVESLIFIGFYIIYIIVLSYWGKWFPHSDNDQKADEETYFDDVKEFEKNVEERGPWRLFLKGIDKVLASIFPDLNKNPQFFMRTFLISIFLIAALSWVMVESAVHLASSLGVSQAIIALTILAGGTSIPDLISSVIVAKRGRGAMAISNAVGSNTFDILVGLGVPWFIYIIWKKKDVAVDNESLFSSIILLFGTVIVMLFLFIIRKFKIGKYSGYFLLFLYLLYLIFAILNAVNPGIIDSFLEII